MTHRQAESSAPGTGQSILAIRAAEAPARCGQ